MNLYHNKYGNICLDFVCVAYYLSQVLFMSTLGTTQRNYRQLYVRLSRMRSITFTLGRMELRGGGEGAQGKAPVL